MDVSGTFNLGASSVWAQSQTRRVTLNADTTDDVVAINLPTIEDINAVGGGAVEIVINDANANAGTNAITVTPGDGNTIEGNATQEISTNSESIIMIIGNDTTWVSK